MQKKEFINLRIRALRKQKRKKFVCSIFFLGQRY